MHHSVLRFLIGLQPAENLARVDIHFRQAAETQHGIGDAARGYAVGSAHAERDVGGGDHPPGNRFAVQQAPVASFSLKRVSNRMAKVQNAAQAIFALVRGNYFGFAA